MKKNKKLWSWALAGALAVSNLSAVAFPITALAAEHFIITYSVNGGTGTIASATTSTESEKEYFTTAKIDNVKKPGYHADGYKIGADETLKTAGDAAVTTNDKVTENTKYQALKSGTLTVQWVADEYVIAYELGGGTAGTNKPVSKTFDSELSSQISDPTKESAAFAGWDLDGTLTTIEILPGAEKADQGSALDAQYKKETGDTVTATAIWYTKYTISFNANGGSGTGPSSIEYSKLDASKTLPDKGDFTREGYDQIGWSTSAKRTSKTFSPKNNPTEDFALNSSAFKTDREENVLLYAVWEAKDVWTVSFDANGGTGSIDPIEVIDGENVKIPENKFTRIGYTPATPTEWNTEKDGSGTNATKDDTVTTTADTVWYSQWTPNTYTIVFDANGGSDAPSPQTPVTYDTKVALSSKGSIAYGANTFLGWSKDANATTPEYEDGDQVKNLATGEEGDTTATLYAVWEAAEDTYSVTYDSNGGTGTISPVKGATLPYTTDNNTNATKKFTKENYTLIGWATDKAATEPEYELGDKIVTSASTEITLFAVWAGDEHTIDFDSNDGTGSMDTQTFVFGTPQKLTKNTFTKADSVFIGWGESAKSTAVKYADEAEIKDLAEDTILYAIWEPIDNENTQKAEEAADAAAKAADDASAAEKAADDAAAAAEKAAADANATPTAETVAAAKAAADAATSAAAKAKEAADAADVAAKAAKEAANLDGVAPEVKDDALGQADVASSAATNAKEAAEAATTAAKAASDAATAAQAKIDETAKKAAETAADGSKAQTPAPVGTELKDASGKATGFKVTNANPAAPEVEFTAPADKDAKSLTVPDTQKDLSGNEYKVTSIAPKAFKDTKVKTITIGKNIKNIPSDAFADSKIKNAKIKGTKLTKKMAKSFKKLKKGGKITCSGDNKKKNKKLLGALKNVKNGNTKLK